MSLTPAGRGLGWLPDEPDDRDHRYAAPGDPLPWRVNLAEDPAMPPVWNQGKLGSCTAHGTLACFLWASAKVGAGDPMLSRLQLYYDTRALEGHTDTDSGGTIRDAVKATTAGIAPETLWPYDISRFAEQPPADVVEAAKANIGVEYQRVGQNLDDMRACLAEGWPIDIGFTVYESFESPRVARTGTAPMPGPGEQVLGGHCVAVVGYCDGCERFTCRNSWGTEWGAEGYFTLPYEFLTDPELASDFWVIKTVT